jgi:hypothetical protein
MAKSEPEIGKAALARKLRVTPAAVTKAIATGRITPRSNGKFLYSVAVAEWRASTDPARTKVKSAEAEARKVISEVVTPEAMTKIQRLLAKEGITVDGPLTMTLARIAETISKTEQREFEMAVQRKEFVPLRHVQKHIERIFTAIKQSFLNLPARHAPTMAAKLGVDQVVLEHLMDQAIRATLTELSEPVIPEPSDGRAKGAAGGE